MSPITPLQFEGENYYCEKGRQKLETQEYIAEVMPDGHLSLPEKVARSMGLNPLTKVRVTIEKVIHEKKSDTLSYEAKQKALAIKEFIADMGPEDLSENLREKYV